MSWLENKSKEQEKFLLIKYENLKIHPYKELNKVVLFLEMDIVGENYRQSSRAEKCLQYEAYQRYMVGNLANKIVLSKI